MSINLDRYLEDLWSSIITNYNYDLFNDQITFSIKTLTNGKSTASEIIISEVYSQYLVSNNGIKRFNLIEKETDDYLELTSISYVPGGVGLININSEEDWVSGIYSSANFIIEIWNSTWFIEANSIKINNVKYDDLINHLKEKYK